MNESMKTKYTEGLILGLILPFLFLTLPESFFNRPESVGCLFRWVHFKAYFNSDLIEKIMTFLNPAPHWFHWIEPGECLSCGLTRAFRHLLLGEWEQAISLHPLSPFFFLTIVCFYLAFLFYCFKKINLKKKVS